jgi:hypothetical protein
LAEEEVSVMDMLPVVVEEVVVEPQVREVLV